MKVYKVLLLIIAIVTIPFSFYNNLPVLSILPISVVIYNYYFKNINRVIMKSISVTIFHLVITIRFVILPFLTAISGDFFSIGRDPDLNILNIAILLMWIELTIHFALVNYLTKKYLLKDLTINLDRTKSIKRTPKILLIYILFTIILLIFFPSLVSNFKLVFVGIDTTTVSFFRGIDIRIILFSQILAYVMLMEFLSRKYRITGNQLFYFVALLLTIINITIIRSENRASILINTLSTFFILVYSFPKQKKFSILTGFFGVLSIVLFVSFLRNERYNIQIEVGNFTDLLKVLQVQLQAYFGGPSYIANGLEFFSDGTYFMNIELILTDILLWSGYLGNIIFENLHLSTLNTSVLYNTYLYGGLNMYGSGDQIIPLAIQGFSYFHIIGFFLIPILMPYLMIIFEKKMIQSNYLIIKYNYMIMVIVFSLYMGYNLSIIGLYFFDRFLIFMIFILSGQVFYKITKGVGKS